LKKKSKKSTTMTSDLTMISSEG